MDQKKQKAWEMALDRLDVDACRALLHDGIDLYKPVLTGDTALHFATSMGNVDMVRFLIEAGAYIDHPGRRQTTPLKVALANHNDELADELIALGASLSYVPPNPDRDYVTPFQMLVWARQPERVRRYAMKYNVDLEQRTPGGKTMIQICGSDAATKTEIRTLKIEMSVQQAISEDDSAAAVRKAGPGML